VTPVPLRWVAGSTAERVVARLDLAWKEWCTQWLGAVPEAEFTAGAASGAAWHAESVAVVGDAEKLIAFDGMGSFVAALLPLGGAPDDASPVAAQLADAAAQALRRSFAGRLLCADDAVAELEDGAGRLLPPRPELPDGSLACVARVGTASLRAFLPGAAVAAHALTGARLAPLPAVSARCFERPARHQHLALELVIGEIEVSLDALQRAEVGDVIVLDAPVAAPFLLRAPSAGLAWEAYLAQHDGRLLAETLHED
jgi:hypothetical protein